MKDLLKWGLILGGGAWAYFNLFGEQPAASESAASGSGPQQTGSTGGGSASQGSSSSGSSTSQTSTTGPVRTTLANVSGPLDFWNWNYLAGQTIDPFTLPRFAGKSIPEVQGDKLTKDEYLAITGLSGLGCTGPVPIGLPCGCGQWGNA